MEAERCGVRLLADKDQFRQQLSLLKKKMKSQPGSRRTQVSDTTSISAISFSGPRQVSVKGCYHIAFIRLLVLNSWGAHLHFRVICIRLRHSECRTSGGRLLRYLPRRWRGAKQWSCQGLRISSLRLIYAPAVACAHEHRSRNNLHESERPLEGRG